MNYSNMLTRSNLYQYQRDCAQHIIDNERCALFVDMGLGKTVSTLTALEFLIYQDLDVNKVLIIAPKRVIETVWSQEATKWEHTRRFTFSTITGTATQRTDAIKREADIYLISRDNVMWLCQNFAKELRTFDALIIDELSSFKNPSSKRFKELRKVIRNFKRVVGLTGTPAPNGLIDLWAQIYLLDQGERLGKTLTAYRNTYFDPDARNGAIVYSYRPKKGSDAIIQSKLSDIVISMKTEDYLQLPDVVYIDVPIALDSAMQKQYDEFERDQVLSLDDTVNAANAAALTNKLLQFANGAIYNEERNVIHLHDEKIEAIKDIVESEEGNVLIAYAYEHDLTRLQEALKVYKPQTINSPSAIERWNNGEIKVLLAHPASAGHGLNLQQGGSLVVWFGLTWSLELYQQFNKRLHRQGQKCAVRIMHLVTKGTMDERVCMVLEGKDATQNSLIEALKARMREVSNLDKV